MSTETSKQTSGHAIKPIAESTVSSKQGADEAIGEARRQLVDAKIPDSVEIIAGDRGQLVDARIPDSVEIIAGDRGQLVDAKIPEPDRGEQRGSPIADDNTQRVSDRDDFRWHAAQNQWSTRTSRGYKTRAGVFDYMRIVYQGWIEHAKDEGLRFTQLDLKRVDGALYSRFQQTKGRPDWLYLPTEAEANLDAITDPDEREREVQFRKREASRMKKTRSKI